jgi:predicted acylesterase/phospholipase RssA
MSQNDRLPDTPPLRHCDVIMKGGITSGVVYPAAGVELAKRFTLKSIGGASAGAIAASLFAAAEYRRSVLRSNAGFEELAKYPDRFGATTSSGKSFLLSLFQPARDARKSFKLLLAFLGNDKAVKVFRVLGTAFLHYPLAFLVGFLPGVLLAVLGFRGFETLGPRVAVLAVALLAFVLGLLIPALVVVFDAIRAVTSHQFGICTGRSDSRRDGDPPALTDWLETTLEDVAFGVARNVARPEGYESADPLTFADLWGAMTEKERRHMETDGGERRINLEVMTTNLTQGRPYRLPFESPKLYFHPQELGTLFSPRIIDFMKRKARAVAGERDSLGALAAERGLIPLPHPSDLPVVVAVRMSLSFPVLISAVPLWGFDFSFAAKDAKGERGSPKLTPCWFSDGGITSNFPIHFFDGPIPRWPTFAFNLTPFHPRFSWDENDETRNVWLPRTNGDGQTENWSNPPKGSTRLSQFLWFLGRIVDTMHNWRDNIQLKVPGFRDRIAQIHLRDEEGGLNLKMDDEYIQALSKRGAYAASVLADRFSDTPPPNTILTWDNHCWVRLRSMMGLFEQQVAKIERAFGAKEGAHKYSDIEKAPPSYHFYDPTAAVDMLAQLDHLARDWSEHPGGLSHGAPRPAPELRILPRV